MLCFFVDDRPILRYSVKTEGLDGDTFDPKGGDVFCYKNPCKVGIVQNKRITADEWEQDVRHMILDIENTAITYICLICLL